MLRRIDNRLGSHLPTVLVVTAAAVLAAVASLPGIGSSEARAQTVAPPPKAATAQTRVACTPQPGRLGVARVIEIDTERGPKFGMQYPGLDFLHDNEVVLTFDDGPLRKHTRMVLDALAAHCTQATFFLVGQMAVTDPEMVREVARAGHTIGIHTWSHRNLRAIGTGKALQEVELGISAVQRALGQPVAPFFRFPYLADSQAMHQHLAARNFGIFSIDVDSRDFRTRDPRQMKRTVMDTLASRRKGILLFHDIQTSTAYGIRSVLDDLASKGYRVVHIVPKGTATSQSSFDVAAEAEYARRNKLAAANPMAPRSVVWPMAPAAGVPIERYRPDAAPAAAGAPARGLIARPQILRPATGGPAPTQASAPAPVPAAAPQPAPAPAAVEQRPAPPSMRGTDEDDWRQRVFQN